MAATILPLAILAAAGGAQPASQPASAGGNATVKVDFAVVRGSFPHPERYNNLTRARNYVEQRDADMQFYNEWGLRGNTYRLWIDAERINAPGTDKFDYSGVEDYLADVSRLSDNILIVMDTRVSIRDNKKTPGEIKPVIKTIMRHLKQRYPKIRYVEAFNEPDHNLAAVMKPEQLYDYYIVYYQAVNEINRELKPRIPLEVGGPAFMMYNETWMRAFLDRYKADPSPAKRVDFYSWHAYGEFPQGGGAGGPQAYHFYKGNPSEVASHRPRFEAELRRRGLDVRIPSFITEMGIYPGPSFDNQNDPRPDYLIGAAGVTSLHYWLLESPRNRPFNWVLRHATEERKDQLMTRAGADRKTPLIRTFSPYGNAMAMMAKLGDVRVAAQSSPLAAGKGVYAIATRRPGGVAVMVWNYQHTDRRSYRATIDMANMPPALRGKTLCRRMYRIDDKISNYWGNPATANLQQVSAQTTSPKAGRHSVTVDLTPNALQLVTVEAGGRCRG